MEKQTLIYMMKWMSNKNYYTKVDIKFRKLTTIQSCALK